MQRWYIVIGTFICRDIIGKNSITIIIFLKFEQIEKLFTSICCIGKLEKYILCW